MLLNERNRLPYIIGFTAATYKTNLEPHFPWIFVNEAIRRLSLVWMPHVWAVSLYLPTLNLHAFENLYAFAFSYICITLQRTRAHCIVSISRIENICVNIKLNVIRSTTIWWEFIKIYKISVWEWIWLKTLCCFQSITEKANICFIGYK